MASKGAAENLKACYNADLFQQYHLLLLDESCMGQGTGQLEEITKKYMEYTLENSNLSVSDVVIADTKCVMDNECEALKQQISDYMKIYQEIYMAGNLTELLNSGEDNTDGITEQIENGLGETPDTNSSWSGTDPRKTLKQIMKYGMLSVVLPAGVSLSKDEIDTASLPSFAKTDFHRDEEVDYSFEDIDTLEEQLQYSDNNFISELQNNYYGITYGLQCFDYFTNDTDYGHQLSCEVEYIICGKNSDYENMNGIVNRIMLHRLPLNVACLMLDRGKLSEVESIAIVLSLIPGVTYGAVKYLLIGTWAYAETLVEIRSLLSGNSIQYVKTGSNWITDINDLGSINKLSMNNYEGRDSIGYKDFLMIFLAENINDMYYRICDVIELNMRDTDSSFHMSNYINSFYLNIDVSGNQLFSDFLKKYYSNNNLCDYSTSAYGSY
jgi:hypothetical protein